VAAVACGVDSAETLPVLVEIRAPDGAEWTYYHCTAVSEQWPAPLHTAWQARTQELAALSEVRPAAPEIGLPHYDRR
jgi:hypothetical protein